MEVSGDRIPVVLDCTLRDGGYYNAWDFDLGLINSYLEAVDAAGIDVVEVGFRLTENRGFKGPCAFTTDEFVRSLRIPSRLKIAVMVNASDFAFRDDWESILGELFPVNAEESPIALVRIASHARELSSALPASRWLADRGYQVALNIMQISQLTDNEVTECAKLANAWPISVLYFADSLGSMRPSMVVSTCEAIRRGWTGAIGFHSHDNMGLALQNSMQALTAGATWLDATVAGMGRGPGNTRTEDLVIELGVLTDRRTDLIPLLTLLRTSFDALKREHGWGPNPYYHLSGTYGVHPTYVQRMLDDSRYDEADLIAVLEYLRDSGAQAYHADKLEGARDFYSGSPMGTWAPQALLKGREVLILGSGPGVFRHRRGLESYIRRTRPVTIALNTQSAIDPDLIDLRVACHPVRLLSDCDVHMMLPQPLVTPYSMLPDNLRLRLKGKRILDFGMIVGEQFEFATEHCVSPSPLVLAYSLAIASSGMATRILLAGFDGYPPGDERNIEVADVLLAFGASRSCEVLALTPTAYPIPASSLYAPTV